MVAEQVFLKACLELEGWCRKGGFHVVFHWIPAHVGIDGNEKADQLAMAAALNGSLPVETGRLLGWELRPRGLTGSGRKELGAGVEEEEED
jgi:hypothetical protein